MRNFRALRDYESLWSGGGDMTRQEDDSNQRSVDRLEALLLEAVTIIREGKVSKSQNPVVPLPQRSPGTFLNGTPHRNESNLINFKTRETVCQEEILQKIDFEAGMARINTMPPTGERIKTLLELLAKHTPCLSDEEFLNSASELNI